MAEEKCTTKKYDHYTAHGQFVDAQGNRMRQVPPTAAKLVEIIKKSFGREELEASDKDYANVHQEHEDKINQMLENAGYKNLKYKTTVYAAPVEGTHCVKGQYHTIKERELGPAKVVKPDVDFKAKIPSM